MKKGKSRTIRPTFQCMWVHIQIKKMKIKLMYLWFTNFFKTKKTTGKTINNTHRYTLYGLQSSLYSYDLVDESHVAWPKTARPSHQNLPIYSQKFTIYRKQSRAKHVWTAKKLELDDTYYYVQQAGKV